MMRMASGTRWPTAVDYQTALQTPALCFDDEDLQQARVHTNALGLPKAATGNVAVVFRVTLDEDEFALRCFTRKGTVHGMMERYEVLNTYIEEEDLDGLVPTFVRDEAILVEGNRYPVALMPWVPGKQVHRAIDAHREDPDYLRGLAERWRELMRYLRSHRFAHGDLSDGNILVDQDGQIHLIDYDAAYVPPLADTPPSEIGKPNYQHLDRLTPDADDYGYYAENVDAFAALVVYLSLRAVAADPSLWEMYHSGDNLIFVQDDYKHPGHTPIWPNLRSSPDPEVRQLTETLERYCLASVADLPSLEEALRGKRPGRRRSTGTEAAPAEVDESGTISVVAHIGESGSLSMGFPGTPDRNGIKVPEADRSPSGRAAPASGGADAPGDLTGTSSRANEGLGGPVAPDHAPAPAESAGSRTWLGASAAAVVVLILSIGGLVLWAPWQQADEAASSSPSIASEGAVAAEDLAGFYTGYNTQPNGERGSIGLEISEPTPAGPSIVFRFTLNSKQYQLEGEGTYDPASGLLELNGQYFLHAQRNARGRVELASVPPNNPNPNLRVTKTDDF